MSVSATGTRTWVHEIRARLASPPPVRLPAERPGRPSAVLVPMFVNAGELWLILTKRAETLNNHSGQIAFPGGAKDPGEDSWQAALRESHEEIGMPPDRVLELGRLDEIYAEVSDYRIVPCVGAVPFPFEPEPNENEIEDVFSVPVLAFAEVKVIEDRVIEWRGRERQIRIYHVGGHAVWGLTARIIQNLLVRLGIEPPTEAAPPAPPAR
ncbi:MAG: CoA pyrophosphatase [Acidobacteriota bacterium]|nr:CoA pyrophosphatase [Acidobacteriota bacterium]MDH3524352.1 CoA pyrophosphatase [Acidobacteriota bacterium]